MGSYKLIIFLVLIKCTTSQVTFASSISPPDLCYSNQPTTNGQRLSIKWQGWIAADLVSKTTVTTFYATVESLTSTAAGIGITELADNQGCSTSGYPSTVWVGYYNNPICYSDFLTFYTTRPSGTTSEIMPTMTVGHAYKFVITPNTNTSVTYRCGEFAITGNQSIPSFLH